MVKCKNFMSVNENKRMLLVVRFRLDVQIIHYIESLFRNVHTKVLIFV